MKQPSEKPVRKKPYVPPKLLVYGDLAQMTQSTGRTARLDGAITGLKRRTGV